MKGLGSEKRMVRVTSGGCARFVFLLCAVMAIAHSVDAVTFTGSLPLTPGHPRYAFCDSFYVELNDVLFDASDIDDDEYEVVPGETTIKWKLRDASETLIAEGNGARVRISSSLPGGPGLITSPGEYSISFEGSATYHLVNRETGEIQPCEAPDCLKILIIII